MVTPALADLQDLVPSRTLVSQAPVGVIIGPQRDLPAASILSTLEPPRSRRCDAQSNPDIRRRAGARYRVAKAIGVPPRRINEIVHGKRGISADTALRLSRALGLSDMFFIKMQAHYDAEIAREHLATALATIDRIA